METDITKLETSRLHALRKHLKRILSGTGEDAALEAITRAQLFSVQKELQLREEFGLVIKTFGRWKAETVFNEEEMRRLEAILGIKKPLPTPLPTWQKPIAWALIVLAFPFVCLWRLYVAAKWRVWAYRVLNSPPSYSFKVTASHGEAERWSKIRWKEARHGQR